MKQVFVGSASAAEEQALELCKLISSLGATPRFWKDSFPPGVLTFEALERMLKQCSGAALLVTPERRKEPNQNVMVEFGLVAGRIGRQNVALCKCGDVRLPSDLLAITYVNLGQEYCAANPAVSDDNHRTLKEWVDNLPETAFGVTTSRLVHGYTGRWVAHLDFVRWRGIPIEEPSIASAKLRFDLIFPGDGRSGFGTGSGEVFLHLDDDVKGPHEARLLMCLRVSVGKCGEGGKISFLTETFSRHDIQPQGAPLQNERLPEETVRPWEYEWDFVPHPETGDFKVTVRTSGEWTKGEGRALIEACPAL